MSKRKASEMQGVDWSQEPCPLCTRETLPDESSIQWIACETKDCGRWYHCHCVGIKPQMVAAYYCKDCELAGRGKTQLREERPKRASNHGIDYGALDAGQHINSLRHSYTSMIESRSFAKSMVRTLDSSDLSKQYLDMHGFLEPIVLHEQIGLDMHIPSDLTVDKVVQQVGADTPLEVMDVPTQGEDKGWTLDKWSTYYNDPQPTRVRNVISLEVSDSELGKSIVRPRIVRDLDVLDNFWPKKSFEQGQMPKVQTYCLMSLQNSYTDFHVDFAGTSVYYHIIQGAKTFLFIPPTSANLKKYGDWCMSSNQSKIFLAEECKDTFKVELKQGDTMMIPPGWIHAVHTPEKSLVIGGNFLHLHGMQKHLEIAALEDKTKVPEKFRFPQFEKTLWHCAIGILAHNLKLCSFEMAGVEALANHLAARLVDHEPSRRQYPEGLPRENFSGDPAILVQMLYNHIQSTHRYRASSAAALSNANKTATITVDLPIARYRELCPKLHEQALEQDKLIKSEIRETVQATLALSIENDHNIVKLVDANPDSTSKTMAHNRRDPLLIQVASTIQGAADTDMLGSRDLADQPRASNDQHDTSLTVGGKPESPPKYAASNQVIERPGTIPNPDLDKSSNGYHDNNYLPPIMTSMPMPNSPPQLHKSLSNHSATDKSATTCFRCKTRKKKCNKERPCDFCLEAGLGDSCRESHTYIAVSPSNTQVQQTPKRKPNPTNDGEAAITPIESKKVKAASDKASPNQSLKKPRKPGHRCGRCAKDKKQCGREYPVCDRCQKKGLGVDDCIYPQTKSSETFLEREGSMPQENTQVLQKPITQEGAPKSHVPQLSMEQNAAHETPPSGISTNGAVPTDKMETTVTNQDAKLEKSVDVPMPQSTSDIAATT